MKRIFLGFLISIFSLQAMAANVCGSGITCSNTATIINNINSPTPTPITIFTAPTTGNTILLAIWEFCQNTNLNAQGFQYYISHNGILYNIFFVVTPQNATYNVLVYEPFVSAPQPNAPVDADGNPFLIINPGDSLVAVSNNNIPASGQGAGPFNFNVQAQTFTQ